MLYRKVQEWHILAVTILKVHKVSILYIITLDFSLFKNIPVCLQTVLLKQGNLQHFHKSELVGGGGCSMGNKGR